jgi:hypothetical protein
VLEPSKLSAVAYLIATNRSKTATMEEIRYETHVSCDVGLTLILASGAAYAQTSTTADPAASDPAAADKMKPFFSDEAMTTMRSDDEIKAAWAAMSADNRKMMKDECEKTDSTKSAEFCGKIKGM